MSRSPTHPRAAYFEEYNEEAHTTLPETRQTANVAAKRSRLDIAKVRSSQSGREETTDSGDSSPTVATVGTRGSSRESKAGNPSLKLDTNVAMSKRKPESAGRKSASTPKSAQKQTLRRTESRPRGGKGAEEECTCDDCMSTTRPSATTRKSSRPTSYYFMPRPKPEAPVAPPPTKNPAPKPTKEIPVIQPAQARPRASTMQSYQAVRPVSFHGGMMLEPLYMPQVFVEQRPMSTFPTPLPFQLPSYPPPKPSYFPANPQPIPRPQEAPAMRPFTYDLPPPLPRPQPRQWTSEHPSNHQPIIYSASPIMEYPPQLHYPPPPLLSQSLPHRPVIHRPATVPDVSYFYDEDAYRMPPPPRVNGSSKHYRPTIRHAVTANTTYSNPHDRRTIRIEDIAPEHLDRRSPRKTSPEKQDRTRRPSIPGRSLQTPERPFPRIRVESNSSAAAKQRHRASYYGHETPYDLEREVEAYQASTSYAAYAPSPPFHDFSADSLKLVRKKQHHGGGSDTGSRVSGEGRGSRDGSEVKPRNSTDRRSDVKTRNATAGSSSGNENEGFTMRFNASQGVNVDLKGGGEGRTISLRQSGEEEGGMELSIGSRMGRERSQRGKAAYLDGSGGGGGGGGRELEYARSVGREGGAGREGKGGTSRSRRSSRSGYAG